MNPKRKARGKTEESLCGGLGPDDGIDPRELFQTRGGRKVHRKTRQLCAQVQRTLDYVLSGECDDEVLRGLAVQSVESAPDASRLLVTVVPLDPRPDFTAARALQRLAAAIPRLRHEVSQSISRRKTPQLAFHVAMPAGAADADDGSAHDPHEEEAP